jgi:peptidoglycan/xylan/chitin deacetylase (PgdA/CDA1 family)
MKTGGKLYFLATGLALVGLGLLASSGVSAQQIAFTFDDLPSHGNLPPGETRLDVANSILATIHANNLPPVYGFVNGVRTETDPTTVEVLKAWRNAGQPLGSHSWSHMSLNDHTPEEFTADIQKNEPLLQSLMPSEGWHWFRYPFLWEGDTLDKRHAVRAYLQKHGYRVAQVTMDFEDYLWNDPYARCMAKHDDASIAWLRQSYLDTADQFFTLSREMSKTLYGRDIPYVLLMHIGAFDAKMLPELIALYKNHGVTFISLEQAERDKAYSEDPDMALKHGGTLIEQMMAARNLKVPPGSKPYKQLEAICR